METDTAAREQLRSAYLVLVDAEWYQANGQWPNALACYTQALIRCENLQRSYPGWQNDMLAQRIADCRNQILILQGKMAQTPAGAGAGAAAESKAAGEEARREAWRDELASVRTLLATPVAPGQPAPAASAAAGDRLAALQRNFDDLLQQHQALEKEKAALEKKLRRLEKRYPQLLGASSGTNAPVHPVCVELIGTEARRLLKDNQIPQAVGLLREALDLLPEDSALRLLLATAYCHAGNYEAALTLLPETVETPGSAAEWHLIRGTAYMGAGRLGAARIEMEKTLKLEPGSSTANYNLAQILVALPAPEATAAERYYRTALEHGAARDTNLERTIQRLLITRKLTEK
jgi:tetratricopeptide (TPR) repeat protein